MSLDAPLSRRDLLQAGMATFAAGATAQALLAQDADVQTKGAGWVDAHSHIWTRDVEKFPLATGKTVDDLAPPSFTAEELMQVAAPEGVDRVVLIQHHTYHAWDNSYLIHAAQQSPKRFRVVGMVDDTSERPDTKMRALLPQRVTGFRITPSLRGSDKWLDGPGMAAMWKCAAETGQAICCLINPSDLPAVDAMCRKFPETRVVIDHFARTGVDGTIRDSDLKQLCDIAKHRHTFVKISAYYALGKKQPPYLDLVPMIRRVVDAYGPERAMWASDSPYQVVDGHSYAASISLVRDKIDFFSESDRQWLLQKTAQKVYFFDV